MQVDSFSDVLPHGLLSKEIDMDIDSAKDKLNNAVEMVKFLGAPRTWVMDQGLDPDDKEVAQTFEKIAAAAHQGIVNNTGTVGINSVGPTASFQGVGFGCCNSL